jgi:hypothetical protein
MLDEPNPILPEDIPEEHPEWSGLQKGMDLEDNYWNKRQEAELNPEQSAQTKQEQAVTDRAAQFEEDKFSDVGDVTRVVAETALQPVLGVADFASDVVGLIPGLKGIDQWWDDNSFRSTAPGHKMLRDASSIIIPTLFGGSVITGGAKAMVAAKAITLPKYVHTLGTVAAYTGVDTTVAMISSHSKTDDNMAATLNNWLGWQIPWATRASDSPDVRWKKNVFEAAGFAGSVELLGAAFAFGRKTQLIGRNSQADELISARNAAIAAEGDPLSAAVLPTRAAREAAQKDEMLKALSNDPNGTVYNAFVNDIGPDDAGRAVINTEPDPLMAKVNHVQIQNNLDTANGRAAAVVDETFNSNFLEAVNTTERARQLDDVFKRISPQFDAVVGQTKISHEQMNKAVDNLTSAIYGQDLSLKEFEFLVDDMKTSIFNGGEVLSETDWAIASKAFGEVYEKMFDPNQMRASAMITQQAADNVADITTGIKMLGEKVDVSRQMGLLFDKLNLLGQEVKINKFIVEKAREYKKLAELGDQNVITRWIAQQGDRFDQYVSRVKGDSNAFTQEMKAMAKENPEFFRAFTEAYDATNGNVDTIFKLNRLAEGNIGTLKKGFLDLNPEAPSMLIKQLHAARINSVLSGLSPVRAAVSNGMLTALKPASVFTGAALSRDRQLWKRAQYTYGGIIENFERGFKVMADDWRLASSHPEEAMMRGRADMRMAKMDQLQYMESMAKGWQETGQLGKVALWNLTKGLGWWNKQWFVRYGTNALYAVDGFTNSFMASGMSRAKAYDQLLAKSNGAIDVDDFRKLQRQLYDEAFDESGKLTDQAAKFASQEIALNLDNVVTKRFEDFLDTVPAAKGLFLFPRTGVNALELSWTFNPLSSLGPAMTKARRVLGAVTKDEKLAALAEHGIELNKGLNMDLAYQTLKSEYIGRQIMGSTVIMGVGTWALNGMITGNGPQDAAEKSRMLAMGWQPNSIKSPIDGKWYSYRGFEPFAQVMGLTADLVYQSTRLDQAITEDFFRKAAYSISMNMTNGTFISGFEPLVGLLSKDPAAWNRFFARQVDMQIPYKGARTILNNVITPQLKDVENDFFAYLANGSKFLYSGNEHLKDLLDVYTGKPIRYHEPVTATLNALLPTFQQNGGMEPWRQWLLSTGWDNLQRIRRNKFTKQPLSSEDRYFINNWIAKNANLSGQIINLMSESDGYWQRKMKEYAKARGLKSQGEFPIKQWVVHRELDRIHDQAFDSAWYALEAYKSQYTTQGREIQFRNYELQQGRSTDALETQRRIQKLQSMPR